MAHRLLPTKDGKYIGSNATVKVFGLKRKLDELYLTDDLKQIDVRYYTPKVPVLLTALIFTLLVTVRGNKVTMIILLLALALGMVLIVRQYKEYKMVTDNKIHIEIMETNV